MPTPIQLPDGRYDSTHTWQNANDRVSSERSFRLDPIERAKIAQALATADPATPNLAIQENMTAGPAVPLPPSEPITVMQCFSRDLGHVSDYAPTNFSGRVSDFSGTSTPSMPAW